MLHVSVAAPTTQLIHFSFFLARYKELRGDLRLLHNTVHLPTSVKLPVNTNIHSANPKPGQTASISELKSHYKNKENT